MWTDTEITKRFGIAYPIVQGPLGGGISSATLVAAVSNAGGLGSYGANNLPPAQINLNSMKRPESDTSPEPIAAAPNPDYAQG